MKDQDYLDDFEDELDGDEDIAGSFYDDASKEIRVMREKIGKWTSLLEEHGIAALSKCVAKGELNIQSLHDHIKRQLKNFIQTTRLMKSRASKAQNVQLHEELEREFRKLCGKHEVLVNKAKVYQTKRLKALQRFQAKQMNRTDMIELENLSKLQLNMKGSNGGGAGTSEMASAVFASADAAAANMMSKLFAKSMVTSATHKIVDEIELQAGWDATYKELRFYTLQFSDPWREKEYTQHSRKQAVMILRRLLILVNFCNAYYTTKEFLYPYYDDGVDWDTQYLLLANVCVLFALLAASFLKGILKYVEILTGLMFLYLSIFFVTFKIVRDNVGPLLLVQLMYIVLFQASAIRFHVNVVIGITCILVYAVAILSSVRYLTSDVDDIQREFTNYIVVIGVGLYTAYTEEQLMRRNFLIASDPRLRKYDSTCVDTSDPRDSEIDGSFDFALRTSETEVKEARLNRHKLHAWTLTFEDPLKEKRFMDGWYIMEKHPYSDSQIGYLHEDAFKVIAVSVLTLSFSSFVLASTQDIESFANEESDMHITWIIRGATVVPYWIVLIVLAINGMCFIERATKVHETKSNDLFPYRYTRILTYVMTAAAAAHLLSLIVIICFLLPDHSPNSITDLYFMAIINLLITSHGVGLKIRHVYATIMTLVVVVIFVGMLVLKGLPAADTSTEDVKTNHIIEYITLSILVLYVCHAKSRHEETNRRLLFAYKVDLMNVDNAYRKLRSVVRGYISRKRLAKQLNEWKKRTRGTLSMKNSGQKRVNEGNVSVTVSRSPMRSTKTSILYSEVLGERMNVFGDDVETKDSQRGRSRIASKSHEIVALWSSSHGVGASDEDTDSDNGEV